MFLSANNKIPYKEGVDYEKIAAQISLQTSKQLEKELGLHAYGIGGAMMDDIKIMALSFKYEKPLNIRAARQLAVYAREAYLSNVNHSESIRPFLSNYPFKHNNIEVSIHSNTYTTKISSLDNLFGIIAIKDVILYNGFDEKGERCTLHQETYAEALEIVKNSPDETIALLNTSK